MKTIDLFAGCGGLSLGFQNAGFEIVAAYDFWKPAVDVYRNNFTSHSIYQMDLSNVDAAISHIKPFSPDIIIGGPPCQDFSHAGKRMEGKRASLTEAYAKIVHAIRPEWFVMENVDRAQQSAAYKRARDLFKDAGYGLTEHIYDASLCGAPQKRKRFICIGKLGETDGFLLDAIVRNESTEPMTMRDYFGDSLGIDYYYRHPRNYNRRGVFSMDEPSPTIRGVNRPIPHGYERHPNDPVDIKGIRPLTTAERAQVQTFPPDFIFEGSKTDLEQIIGNAVPVKLAEFVGKRIVEYIDSKNNRCVEELRNWLIKTKEMTPASAKDVISRINRVRAISPILHKDTLIDINYKLAKNASFEELSGSVKSQIKRAISLYFEFTIESKHKAAFSDFIISNSAAVDQAYRKERNGNQIDMFLV